MGALSIWAAGTGRKLAIEVVTGVFVDRALEAEKSQREYQVPGLKV